MKRKENSGGEMEKKLCAIIINFWIKGYKFFAQTLPLSIFFIPLIFYFFFFGVLSPRIKDKVRQRGR